MRHFIFSFLIFGFIFSSCTKEEKVVERDYPYLITYPVDEITESSVTFHGKILNIGIQEITEYGFLFGNHEDLNLTDHKAIINEPFELGPFSVKVNYGLTNETMQYVRAYAKTHTWNVLGNVTTFTSNGGAASQITNITPLRGYVGTEVTITGENFGLELDANKVFFGEKEAEIVSFSYNKIVAIVPETMQDVSDSIFVKSNNKLIPSDFIFQTFTHWRKIADFPGDARYAAIAFSINGIGYVGTGAVKYKDDLKDFWKYDPELNQWTQIAEFPGEPRGFAVSFVIDGKAYVGFGLSNDSYQHDLWQYDPILDKWLEMTGNEWVTTYSDACFVVGNQARIFTQFANYAYTPETNSWVSTGNIPFEYRFFTQGLSCNDESYIIAGEHPGNHLLKDMWCYSANETRWRQKPDFPGGNRHGITAFSIRNDIYAGFGHSSSMYKDFYRYAPATEKWTRIENFIAEPRELAVVFTIGDKAYVGSGLASTELKDFYEFDPTKE